MKKCVSFDFFETNMIYFPLYSRSRTTHHGFPPSLFALAVRRRPSISSSIFSRDHSPDRWTTYSTCASYAIHITKHLLSTDTSTDAPFKSRRVSDSNMRSIFSRRTLHAATGTCQHIITAKGTPHHADFL